MNQLLLNQKREQFRVEIRRMKTELIFKQNRKQFLEHTPFTGDWSMVIPSTLQQAEWVYSLLQTTQFSDSPAFLECMIATTYHYTKANDPRLGPYIEVLLNRHYQLISEGTAVEPNSTIEDALIVIYNLGAQANKTGCEYTLSEQTIRIVYQLLVIYNSPEIYMIAQKVVHQFLPQFTDHQRICECSLTALCDSENEDLAVITIQTLNLLIRSGAREIPPIPVAKQLLNSPNLKVRTTIVEFFANVSAQDHFERYVDDAIIQRITLLFQNEATEDILAASLDFLSNVSFSYRIHGLVTNLVFLQKVKALLHTNLIRGAWNFLCTQLCYNAIDALHPLIQLSILNEMKMLFVTSTDMYFNNQFLEAILYIEEVRFDDSFTLKLQDIAIHGDQDGREMAQILLQRH